MSRRKWFFVLGLFLGLVAFLPRVLPIPPVGEHLGESGRSPGRKEQPAPKPAERKVQSTRTEGQLLPVSPAADPDPAPGLARTGDLPDEPGLNGVVRGKLKVPRATPE